MKISKKDWEKYRDKLAIINQKAAELMESYVERHGLGDRKALISYAQALSDRYGEAAAALACQFYDDVAAVSGVDIPTAEPAETSTIQETAREVNGAIKRSFLPQNVGSAVGRLVKRSASDTIIKNALRDGAEFAWIPSGDTCPFCLMLASNGWQYASKQAIRKGHAVHIHQNCNCEYAIRFDRKSEVEGYDPEVYKQAYEKADGNTWQEKIRSMEKIRREADPESYNRRKRNEYARRRAGQWTDYITVNRERNSQGSRFNTEERERIKVKSDGKVLPGNVNIELVNTEKFHRKFENLTDHKDVNEALYNEAMEILAERNNTEFEDIVAIDSRTGERIVKNTSSSKRGKTQSCGFSKEEERILDNYKVPFETLHNHPNSSMPSRDDIKMLFRRHNQSASNINCHNGTVYRIKKLKPLDEIEKLVDKVYYKTKERYQGFGEDKVEFETSTELLQYLTKSGHIRYLKR